MAMTLVVPFRQTNVEGALISPWSRRSSVQHTDEAIWLGSHSKLPVGCHALHRTIGMLTGPAISRRVFSRAGRRLRNAVGGRVIRYMRDVRPRCRRARCNANPS